MEKKKLGFVLVAVGIIIFLVSLFADPLGIGGYPGLGVKQIGGMILGLVIIIVGYMRQRKTKVG